MDFGHMFALFLLDPFTTPVCSMKSSMHPPTYRHHGLHVHTRRLVEPAAAASGLATLHVLNACGGERKDQGKAAAPESALQSA
jgi:hypothetical protein